MNVFEQGEAKLHQRASRNLRLDNLRVDGFAGVYNGYKLSDFYVPSFGIDFHSAPAPEISQKGVMFVLCPVSREAGT